MIYHRQIYFVTVCTYYKYNKTQQNIFETNKTNITLWANLVNKKALAKNAFVQNYRIFYETYNRSF
ncbi:hypothetical protein GCM10025854_07870 [Tetragenococcus muriaticus]|nr:hypothetical protein GCM10025854_07870 [Tetragenococcus muriaticus]